MLPLDARSGMAEAQTPPAPMVSERLDDMIMAQAIARAMHDVPGVLKMGQGVFATAATYGPGKHIKGVVFHHAPSGELSVEVHVILDEAALVKGYTDESLRSDNTPIMLRCTDHIRTAVSHTLQQFGVLAPTLVDVTIDDIR